MPTLGYRCGIMPIPVTWVDSGRSDCPKKAGAWRWCCALVTSTAFPPGLTSHTSEGGELERASPLFLYLGLWLDLGHWHSSDTHICKCVSGREAVHFTGSDDHDGWFSKFIIWPLPTLVGGFLYHGRDSVILQGRGLFLLYFFLTAQPRACYSRCYKSLNTW